MGKRPLRRGTVVGAGAARGEILTGMARTWPSRRQLLLVLGFALATLSGCTSQEAIEKARARGAQAGREEGRNAGETEGYAKAFYAGKADTYRETLEELLQQGQYRRIPFLTAIVLGGFFLLGFCLQWVTLYALRR